MLHSDNDIQPFDDESDGTHCRAAKQSSQIFETSQQQQKKSEKNKENIINHVVPPPFSILNILQLICKISNPIFFLNCLMEHYSSPTHLMCTAKHLIPRIGVLLPSSANSYRSSDVLPCVLRCPFVLLQERIPIIHDMLWRLSCMFPSLFSSAIQLFSKVTKVHNLKQLLPSPHYFSFDTILSAAHKQYNSLRSQSMALLPILLSSTILYGKSKLQSKGITVCKAIVISLFLTSFDQVEGAKGGFGCNKVTAGTACLPKHYSKYELPNPTGPNPIKVELLIHDVLRINDKDYSITFSCYYNIYWPDPRLQLSADFGREQAKSYLDEDPNFNITMNPNIQVPMNLEMINDLWIPNILIYNLKTYKVMDVLSKLAGLWISADYTILYSQATHITFICPMHFDKFPLDTQSCKFQIGSYSYDDTQMTFQTGQARYDGKETNSIALDYAINIRKLRPKDTILVFEGLGNYSLAGFELELQRYVSTYIITYYLPSGLFVIVSWISFLIPMDVIPGRMALLVTLFLVLVNIFNNVTTNTPKAEGLTAIEAWMLACILFVFGALIE